jgi:capsule polysaccharide export protein KpsE/RkpR
MTENNGLEFLDYLIIVAKWKKFLLITFISIAIISYSLIYFLIKEQYDASALIIPNEQQSTGAFSSLLKDFSSLPIGIDGLNVRNDNDFYTAIIYSRSNLEKIIRKFNLVNNYKAKNIEEAIKILSDNIKTDETKEEAYRIICRADSPKMAADLTNFVVDELNKTVIDLNIKKTKDNRLFLEKRYFEIKSSLTIAEDSLRLFQQSSGIYEAKDQAEAIIQVYTKLESELATKKVELAVYRKLYGDNSPQTNNAKIAEEELSSKISSMKKGEKGNVLLGINTLPEKAMKYVRYYRDVEIYNKMLEFIVPLYEKARFDEQKTAPVLQILDHAVPPLKRAYPQRTLMALGVSFAVVFLTILGIILRDVVSNTDNKKLLLLKKEISFSRKLS